MGEAMCRGGSGLLWGHGAAVVQVWCGSMVSLLILLNFCSYDLEKLVFP